MPTGPRSPSRSSAEIAAPQSGRVAEFLRQCFRSPCEPTPPLDAVLDAVLDDDRVPALLQAVDLHRVASTLAEHRELFEAAPSTASGIRGLHLAASRDALQLMALTTSACSLLDDAGIRALVMKGIGLAAVQGRGPSSRGSGDLDLWVHDDDIARTVEVLRSLGYRPEEPAAVALVTSRSRRARMYRWITPEVTLLHDDGPPIDLHFRLLRSTSHVPIDFGSAWGRSVVIPGTHEQGRTLCAGDALRHSSAHATKDCWDTLRHVVDVVHLARAVDGAELTRLCETDRSVDLAVAVASNLDPQLGRFRSSSARTTRLARTAWTMCLSLAMRPQTIATQPTMTNIRSRAAVLIWQVRTSPDARTALHPIIEAPLSMRALSDPAPLPIGVLKDLVARTRENRT